ncbi:MAG: AarF/UbiB family protein [Candidatus Woesearchaeota archaeon]|nr:AarF/UbiB family protein [Candidatus Woesearchaeota archaeon]
MAKITREKFKVYSGVFDEFTLNTLEFLKRKNYYDKFGKPIKTGKEGDVYSAVKGEEIRAIKIYRLTNANFKKISEYINRDFRFRNIKGNLRKSILVWVQKEYRNLSICHKANMNVPYPYKQSNNIIIMEYIEGGMLKDIPLSNPEEFFDLLIEQMYIMKHEAKLIHGDLSEFNIMVKDDLPVIIDMGQAMTIKNNDDFKEFYDLYERDVKNVVRYFNKRYSLNVSEEETFQKLL